MQETKTSLKFQLPESLSLLLMQRTGSLKLIYTFAQNAWNRGRVVAVGGGGGGGGGGVNEPISGQCVLFQCKVLSSASRGYVQIRNMLIFTV